MSLRFDRKTPPKWNSNSSRVDFTCIDSHTRQPVHCAVSRAALEDSTGETLDARNCVGMFARHLGRITAVANSISETRELEPGSVILIDSDELLQQFPHGQLPGAAHAYGAPTVT